MLFEFFKINYAKGNYTNRTIILFPGSNIFRKDGIASSRYFTKIVCPVFCINYNDKCSNINFYEAFA